MAKTQAWWTLEAFLAFLRQKITAPLNNANITVTQTKIMTAIELIRV